MSGTRQDQTLAALPEGDPKYIYVIFDDVAASDWAGEGKLFGDG